MAAALAFHRYFPEYVIAMLYWPQPLHLGAFLLELAIPFSAIALFTAIIALRLKNESPRWAAVLSMIISLPPLVWLVGFAFLSG